MSPVKLNPAGTIAGADLRREILLASGRRDGSMSFLRPVASKVTVY
jgi:hypothetical protein